MPLRLVFLREDLLRVRLALAPDPLWELICSLHLLQARDVPDQYAQWRRHAGSRMARPNAPQEELSVLTALVPPRGNFPDFLTPAPVTTDLDAGCEAILHTPRARVADDITTVFTDRQAPAWAAQLAAGDYRQMQTVVAAMRHGYDVLVAPEWQRIRHTVTTDRARRADIVLARGVEGLLATLPGTIGWDGTVLTVAYPRDHTISLAGRGLTLVPSFFTTRGPVTLINPELPPVLVYPALTVREPQLDSTPTLSRLITRTRAECLQVLLAPHSTSALACRLGISVGTACKQATVLRESGLISSTRDGAAVIHQTTSLGIALISAQATRS